MRTWFRAYGVKCGRCGARLDGVPCLAITGASWQLYRCRTCADEPAPVDDAALPSTPPAVDRRATNDSGARH